MTSGSGQMRVVYIIARFYTICGRLIMQLLKLGSVLLGLMVVIGLTPLTMADTYPLPSQYTSPYTITYSENKSDLTWDFASRLAENPTDFTVWEWYTKSSVAYHSAHNPVNEAWGPQAKVYDAMPGYQDKSVSWLQQRVLASAEQWIGTPYQHRHIPQFDPYGTGGIFTPDAAMPSITPFTPVSVNASNISATQWAWNDVENWNESGMTSQQYSPGIDCSDFTSYAYNFALGTKLITNVANQCEYDYVTMPGDGNQQLTVQIFAAPSPGNNTPAQYGAFVNSLQPGDLLFMQEDATNTQVSHVIMWLGEYGTLADGTVSSIPLIINSHDNTPEITDLNGIIPPTGVQILPFRDDEWFYHRAVEVHRIVPAIAAIPEPTTGLIMLALSGMLLRRRPIQVV